MSLSVKKNSNDKMIIKASNPNSNLENNNKSKIR